jgi:hypothetical protein
MKNMSPITNRTILPGVILVVIGLVMLLAAIPGVGAWLIPAAVGVCFLAAYFVQRRYGFLVAGSIVTGLGIGAAFEPAAGGNGTAAVIGLGLGFMAIFVVDSLRGSGIAHWWPLVPGTILVLVAIEQLTQNETIQGWLANWWPLALVAVGVLVIVRTLGGRRPTS